MLKTVQRPNGNGGLRVVSITRFVWDGGALVHELKRTERAEGGPLVEERTYVFEQGRTVPLAHRDTRIEGGKRTVSPWWHYINDDTGAPMLLVAPDGRIGCELHRAPWGAAVIAPGALTTTPFRFRGQYADEETGLCYNRHRYYDPEIGRYISADPIGLEGGVNAFAYAGNCPTSAVDVDGLIYSIIKAGKKIVATGHNLTEGGGVGDEGPRLVPRHSAIPSDASESCAETTALTRLAHQMGPQTKKEDIAKRFNEDGYTIETYEGNENDYEHGIRVGANPCSACKQMFGDIEIVKGIIGHAPDNPKKIRPLDRKAKYKDHSAILKRERKRKKL
jgi:RHS repeat-associated protein